MSRNSVKLSFIFAGSRTAAELPRKSTSNDKHHNRVNMQRDEASVSSDKERQEVPQHIH
jgi:hypothetical protein